MPATQDLDAVWTAGACLASYSGIHNFVGHHEPMKQNGFDRIKNGEWIKSISQLYWREDIPILKHGHTKVVVVVTLIRSYQNGEWIKSILHLYWQEGTLILKFDITKISSSGSLKNHSSWTVACSVTLPYVNNICGPLRQNRVSAAWINNYTPHLSAGCNCLSIWQISGFDVQLHICGPLRQSLMLHG